MLSILFDNQGIAIGNLKATTEKIGDILVIRPKGRVTLAGGDARLGQLMLDALERGERRILLDMRGVTSIDSSGIGELTASYLAARERGGAIKLYGLSDKVFGVFQTVALLRVFDVRETEVEGLAAFDAEASSL